MLLTKDVARDGLWGRKPHHARTCAPTADGEGHWVDGSSARLHGLQFLPPLDQTQGSAKIHRDVQGLVASSSSVLVSLATDRLSCLCACSNGSSSPRCKKGSVPSGPSWINVLRLLARRCRSGVGVPSCNCSASEGPVSSWTRGNNLADLGCP